MKYLGDYSGGATLDFTFSTHAADGTPTALVDGVVSVYKANGTTQSTEGVTLTASFDSVTGLNHVRIVLTNAFYATGNDYSVVLTAGTVDGVSVVGTTLALFSIENRTEADIETAVAALPTTSQIAAAAFQEWLTSQHVFYVVSA
jgi:hypothetical protein